MKFEKRMCAISSQNSSDALELTSSGVDN
jgi:hypothetical protein